MEEVRLGGRTAPARWLYPAALGGLFAIYSPVFYYLYHAWILQPYYSHGFLVPIVSFYLALAARKRLREASSEQESHTIRFLILGLLIYFAGLITDFRFLMYISFPVSLGGLVLFISGPEVLRLLTFPLAYLFLMFPLPYSLTSALAFPLQLASSRYAALVLDLLGISVLREGVNIHIPGYSFIIERGCSGLQSTVALCTLAVLLAYLARGALKKRLFLVFSAVPIALMANVLRIVLVILVAKVFGQEAAESFFHTFSSLFLFMIAFILLYGTARYIGCLPLRRY